MACRLVTSPSEKGIQITLYTLPETTKEHRETRTRKKADCSGNPYPKRTPSPGLPRVCHLVHCYSLHRRVRKAPAETTHLCSLRNGGCTRGEVRSCDPFRLAPPLSLCSSALPTVVNLRCESTCSQNSPPFYGGKTMFCVCM